MIHPSHGMSPVGSGMTGLTVSAVRQWVDLDQLLLLGESDGERAQILHLILAKTHDLQS